MAVPTRFGRFISGRFFQKLFLILYTVFMCFSAYETEAALCLLIGLPHSYGIVYIVFAVFAVLIIFKKSIFLKHENRFFKKLISFLSCFFIYYLLTLLGWELLNAIFDFSNTLKSAGVIGSFVLSWLIVLFGYLYTKHIAVKRYDVAVGNTGKQYRIALISDIHLGVFVGVRHVRRIVQKINKLHPDVVLISGDIFDVDNSLLKHPEELKAISKVFCKLKASEGVYAVVGNHDPEISNKLFQKFLKMSRIKLLNDDVKELSQISIVGRTDCANNPRADVKEVFGKLSSNKPSVVLEHRPENIEESAKYGADLVLCGHTHRGQMFPINFFTRWANGKGNFYGYSEFEGTKSIVTSGVGFFELPVRVGTSNEVVDIQLEL